MREMVLSEECVYIFEDAVNEFDNVGFIEKKPLRNCQATVYITEKYYVLRSYNTIVCVIDRVDGVCYDMLRYVYGYTATSSKHIRIFAEDYNASVIIRWYSENHTKTVTL